MPDTPKDDDTKRGDEILRRMLKTPPKPHKGTGAGNTSLTDTGHKKKPGGPSAKKDHPEAQ